MGFNLQTLQRVFPNLPSRLYEMLQYSVMQHKFFFVNHVLFWLCVCLFPDLAARVQGTSGQVGDYYYIPDATLWQTGPIRMFVLIIFLTIALPYLLKRWEKLWTLELSFAGLGVLTVAHAVMSYFYLQQSRFGNIMTDAETGHLVFTGAPPEFLYFGYNIAPTLLGITLLVQMFISRWNLVNRLERRWMNGEKISG